MDSSSPICLLASPAQQAQHVDLAAGQRIRPLRSPHFLDHARRLPSARAGSGQLQPPAPGRAAGPSRRGGSRGVSLPKRRGTSRSHDADVDRALSISSGLCRCAQNTLLNWPPRRPRGVRVHVVSDDVAIHRHFEQASRVGPRRLKCCRDLANVRHTWESLPLHDQ
jgi:hypothetical protein